MPSEVQQQPHRTREQAQTAVEFALMVVALLVILMGIVEAGRLLQSWLTVQNVAQAGTRFAVTGQCFVDPTTDPWDKARLQCIKEAARRAAGSLSIDASAAAREPGYFEITVRASDPPPTTTVGAEYAGGPNQRVTVLVLYNHELITPLARDILPWVALQARSEMITERYRHPGLNAAPGVLPPEIPVIIKGYALTADDPPDPIAGVTLSGLPGNPVTDSDGFYLAEVEPGWDGVVAPNNGSCVFEPPVRTYTSVTSDMPSEDYVAQGSCP